MTKIKVDHFIPLIGPFIIATDQLNKKGLPIETRNIYSHNGFEANEVHIKNNGYGEVEYLPEDVKYSVDKYRTWFKSKKIEAADMICCVPPCAGLSMLNSSVNKTNVSRGCNAVQNGWIYEGVYMYLGQGAQCCVIENAPGLVGGEGRKVLRKIKEILDQHGSYMIHVSKTNTICHGLPQSRSRAFCFIYKKDDFSEIRGFQTVSRPFVRLEKFLKRPEKIDLSEGSHDMPITVISSKGTQPWLDFTLKHDLHNKTRKQMEDFTCSSVIDEFMREANEVGDVETYVKDKERYKMLIHTFNHINAKAEDKLGFWDTSPIVSKGKVNAVISKNLSRMLHPIFDRFITFREAMDLMGLPDTFIVKDFQKNITWNHICQNIPINTASDHLVLAAKCSGLIKSKKAGTVTLFSGFDIFNNLGDLGIIMQDNSSGDAIQNSYFLNKSNEWEKIS